MTHLHIPDGILPAWLWVTGLLLMVLALAASIYRLRGMDRRVKVPLLGVLSAAMLVVMNLEVLPIAYHLNLSVAAGILLGPPLGFIAAFIVNVMLALLGHGGVTVLGLNTLMLGTEAMLGHVIFFLLPRRLPVFWRAALATVLALMLVTGLLIAVVALSHTEVASFLRDHDHGAGEPPDHAGEPASVASFAVIVLSLGAVGWIIEASVTGGVLRFIAAVKPDLLAHALHSPADRGPAAGGGA
jgi:cobalt/nickel transport system permease protein